MIRLFAALKIPLEIRNQIEEIRQSLSTGYDYLRWEPKEKIHLTLKFIGEVSEKLTVPIIETLGFIEEEYNSFKCELTKFGFFHRDKIPSTLWLGLKIDDRIYDLVSKLNDELEKFSIPKEKKKFKPHLTLLRLKGKSDEKFITSFESSVIPKIEFNAAEIALVQSQLNSKGSIYNDLKIFKLKN